MHKDPEYPEVPYLFLRMLFSSPDVLDFTQCRLLTPDMSMANASDLNIPPPQFTSLESLHLKGQFDWNIVDIDYSSPLFIHTPRLSELRLFDTGFITEFQLPLEQIRTLWLQQYEVPGGAAMHMVSIVEHLPRLETLVLYDIFLVESIHAMTKEASKPCNYDPRKVYRTPSM